MIISAAEITETFLNLQMYRTFITIKYNASLSQAKQNANPQIQKYVHAKVSNGLKPKKHSAIHSLILTAGPKMHSEITAKHTYIQKL